MARLMNGIQSDIDALCCDHDLYAEMRFADRAAALDFLDFDVLAQIESLAPEGVDRVVGLRLVEHPSIAFGHGGPLTH